MTAPNILTTAVAGLRDAGATFAFIFGSTVAGTAGPQSDIDVAAWWPGEPPQSWDVEVPPNVDLTILNRAPLWLAGRVALEGKVLFDDDPPRRVAWQADTRFIYLDEIPELRKRQRDWLKAVTDG